MRPPTPLRHRATSRLVVACIAALASVAPLDAQRGTPHAPRRAATRATTKPAKPVPTRAEPRILHVAVAPGLDADAAAGVTFGLAEAARLAARAGDSVAVHVLGEGEAPIDVIIAGGDATSCRELGRLARARRALVIDAWCEVPDQWAPGPLRGGHFAVLHVGPPAALRDAVAEREGVIARRVVAWDPALLARESAAPLAERWRAAHAVPLGERAWRGWAAVKLVADIAASLDAPPRAPALVAAFARAPALDAHKGAALHFGACDGVLRQPLYVTGDGTPATLREVAWPEAAVTRCGWRR